MPANLENSAVATGLEKVSFHSILKERQCQRMLKLLHNCTHNGNPLQYSCLENPMDGAWWAALHGVTRSRTQLSDFTFTFHFHALEKEMAAHSSVLAWRIPGKREPGGLLSMASHRVGHDWSDLAAAATAICDNSSVFPCFSWFCTFFSFFHDLKLLMRIAQLVCRKWKC